MPPIELREPAERAPDRWEHLSVPLGWEPIADICRAIRDNLPSSVADSVHAIRSEVPLYRRSVVPQEDLVGSVERNLDMLLIGIAERRGPTPAEIESLSELGSRRAHQGVPVDTLLQAYHVGYRDLWRRFLKSDDDELSHLLLNAATTMWEWTHRVTDGIGRAHAETTHLLAMRAAGSRHRFLELLLAGDVDSDEMRTLCRSLGFDARGSFRASVVCGTAIEGALVSRFQAELDLLKGVHQAIPHGPRLIVVSQNDEPSALEDAIGRLLPDAVIGVGFTRDGFGGARLSVGDAERAADAADAPGVHTFDRGWMWAVFTREEERLHGFLRDGRRIARDNPSLAQTVEAFAANGFSVSAAARQLHIHPNTASYRLDRWLALTGWDPRTFDGLARSLAALRLPTAVEDDA